MARDMVHGVEITRDQQFTVTVQRHGINRLIRPNQGIKRSIDRPGRNIRRFIIDNRQDCILVQTEAGVDGVEQREQHSLRPFLFGVVQDTNHK